MTHQNFSRARSVHFTQLISNLASTNSVDPTSITQDHKGEYKLPCSPFMEDRVQRLNAEYSEQLSDVSRIKRPDPTQPVFYSRFASATDNPNVEENSPFYGSDIPEDYCMLLSEKSLPMNQVEGGQVNLIIE